MAKKQKLNITFHNPNTEEEVAKVLVKLVASNIHNMVSSTISSKYNEEDIKTA